MIFNSLKGKTVEEIYGIERAGEIRQKQSNSRKGKTPTEETKIRMSGKTPWNKGKKATPEAIKHQSESHIGKASYKKGKTHEEIYGVKRAKELRQKNKECHMGNTPPQKGKTYEEMYGIERAGELRQISSKAHKGKPAWNKGVPMAEESKEKSRKSHLGYKPSEETKRKQSEAAMGRIVSEEARHKQSMAKKDKPSKLKGRTFEEIHGLEQASELREKIAKRIQKSGYPFPSMRETMILNELEIKYNTKIIRQYRVCGYFVDGYSPELNVAFEIDEKHHFNFDGTRKEIDIKRQKNIENKLKCKFIRIKDTGGIEW